MNKEEAQNKLYWLSEVFGELNDQIKSMDERAGVVNAQRRELVMAYPTLDLRRPSRI